MSHQMLDVFRHTMEKSVIFVTLSEILDQLKPSIRIYPSQDAVYKLDGDNVRSHLFMQALREIGAHILEPYRAGQDYTVKHARILFGALLPSPTKQQPSPTKPLKTSATISSVVKSEPNVDDAESGEVKLSLSQVLATPVLKNLDSGLEAASVRPAPIDPYAVKGSGIESSVQRRPKRGNHSFSYRTSRKVENDEAADNIYILQDDIFLKNFRQF